MSKCEAVNKYGLREYSFEIGPVDDSSETVAIVGIEYSSVSEDETFYRKEDVDNLLAEKDVNMTNIAEEFIKSKGLEEEYHAYVNQRENNANGVKVNFDIMLGDADGHHRETISFTKHVLEEFRKYFECSQWGNAMKEVELLNISREWGPGATIYADQLQKLFHKLVIGDNCDSIETDNKHSLARFRFMASKEDVADWVKNEYYMEPDELDEDPDAADFADDLGEFFNDMYFRYVKPYVDDGIFVQADKYGAYGISC